MPDYQEQIQPIFEKDLEINDLIDKINTRFEVIGKLISDSLAFIKVDSYTGDGIRERRYAGIGFKPRAVFIFTKPETYDFHLINIITESANLISDGFIIDDNKEVNDNKNLATYYYIALG